MGVSQVENELLMNEFCYMYLDQREQPRRPEKGSEEQSHSFL